MSLSLRSPPTGREIPSSGGCDNAVKNCDVRYGVGWSLECAPMIHEAQGERTRRSAKAKEPRSNATLMDRGLACRESC